MIEKFREKLFKKKKTLSSFHREFIRHIPGKKITYTYFGMMINDPDRMKPEVEAVIKKYLAD